MRTRTVKVRAWLAFFTIAALLWGMAVLAVSKAAPVREPQAKAASCQTQACWRRVAKARAIRWCKRNEECLWRHRFHSRPRGWQSWAWSTARCESGLRFHIATGNGYYGGLQFSASTAWSAGFRRLPHLVTKWEQMTRAIDFARRFGVQHWPVCGR